MDKQQLKAEFGHITDTDRLTDDIMQLLTTYNHRNSEHGVTTILQTFFTNNAGLIDLLSKHPAYDGNLRIVVEKEFVCDDNERRDALRSVLRYFVSDVDAERMFTTKDDDGKTEWDYRKSLKIKSVNLRRPSKGAHNVWMIGTKVQRFTEDGITVESQKKYRNFSRAVNVFAEHVSPCISHDFADTVNLMLPERSKSTDLAKNMKTSRAFQRMCSVFGVTENTTEIDGKTVNLYERAFAKYSDVINQAPRKRKFVVSINPYDYLTMSFGKSWASCHTIDTRNRRGMDNAYHGQYCNGTLSYMLDAVSIITFVVDKDDDIQTAGKLYRNMFHWNGSVLMQGRIYPQANDGAVDLYKTYRYYMQEILSECLGIEDKWIKHADVDDLDIDSYGHHYQDYNNFTDCNYSVPKASSIYNLYFSIGHNGICPYCGERTSMSSSLSHSVCFIES